MDTKDFPSVEAYLEYFRRQKLAEQMAYREDLFRAGWLRVVPHISEFHRAQESEDFTPLADLSSCTTLEEIEDLGAQAAKDWVKWTHAKDSA